MGTHRDWLDNTKFSIGRFLCSLPMAYNYYDSIADSCVIFIFGSTCNGKLRCLTSLFYFNIEQIQILNLDLHFKSVVLFTNIKI